MYGKEVHSGKLSRLQKVGYIAAVLEGDSWLGLPGMPDGGEGQGNVFTEEWLVSGATESKMEDGSNWGY